MHVGLPKTATTSMQTWFKIHRPKLKRLGVWNPPFPTRKRGKHTFILQEIHDARDFRTLSRILHNAPSPAALVSHEGLSNQIDRISKESLDKFRHKTRDVRKTVILVTRNGEAWSSSFYKQCVLGDRQASEPWRGTSMTLDQFRQLDHIQLMMTPAELIPRIQDGYGASDVVHVRLEDPDWFVTILERMGLESLKHLSLPAVNEAVPGWVTDFMLRINQRYPENEVRNAWRALLQGFTQTKHGKMIISQRDCTEEALAALDLTFITELRTEKGAKLQTEYGDILEELEGFAKGT